MKKFASLAALVMLPLMGVLFSTSAFAAPGQLAGGSNLYKVRNVTQNGSYHSSISAVCNDTVKYSVEVSNTQYGALTDVTVKANLASGNIHVSAKNDSGVTVTSDGTVHVSVTDGVLGYVSGSTQLYKVDGTFIKTLPDGVATSGVNAGDLGGSTREFVQFQAKVNCEEVPSKIKVCELATKKIITIDEKDFNAKLHSKNLADCGELTVCRLEDKKVVTIKESDFDSAKYTTDLEKCETPVTPPELPHTGSTGALIAVVASLLTAAAAYAVTSRKNVLG
jgi:hypothetical protein